MTFDAKQWFLPLVLVLLAAGCGEQGASSGSSKTASSSSASRAGSDFSPVIARVNGAEITQDFFNSRYESLPANDKGRFTGANWEQRFLEYLVEETLIYQAAEEEEFDNLPDIQRQLESARRSLMVNSYYQRRFNEDLEVPEEEITTFYENNIDTYVSLGRVLVSHVQCSTLEKAQEARKALDDDVHFGRVVAEYSENEVTRAEAGVVGWVNPGGFARGIGFNEAFDQAIWSMKSGEIKGPIEIDGAWHVLRVTGRVESETEPLEKVRDRVIAQIKPRLSKQAYQDRLLSLRSEADVKTFGKYQIDENRTAEQLYRIGAETQNAHAKLHYYESLVRQYPKDDLADDAQFMIGFLYSEQLADAPMAFVNFNKLMKTYPESEYVDEAQWMLKNLGRAEPRLLGRNHPQNPESAIDRIREVQN